MEKLNYCYILRAIGYGAGNNTYNGFSNNIERRIRQHCGLIKGGAKHTTRHKGGWEYIVQITSLDPRFDQRMALSLEWHIKYPKNLRPRPREFNGAIGRIQGLNHVFQLAETRYAGIHLEVYILKDLAPFLSERNNITIHHVDNFTAPDRKNGQNS